MDSLITAAAQALSVGDPLGALKRVALRDDAPALALRGIAIAQLGDFERAKLLLRRAARAFGTGEPVARARCIVAEAEVALASRDLGWPARALAMAQATLARHGDRVNAAHARCIEVRRLLLIGRLDEAERLLADIDPTHLPPALATTRALALAGIATRRLQANAARTALAHALTSARKAGVAALTAEVQNAIEALDAPAAWLLARGHERLLSLHDVEALLASPALIMDGCRYVVRQANTSVHLARRPVLFALARTLAAAWPADASRETLITQAFRMKRPDESLRARLRVELGRLRRALQPMADITATAQGFRLLPRSVHEVVVLASPVEEKHSSILALLADGEAWSSSALALASRASQRNVQRALDALATAGKVQAFGHGRARRWLTAPLPGIATALLLPAPLPGG